MNNKRTKFSQTACEVMNKNEDFLFENYKDIVDEIVELANDAIDYVSSYAKQDKGDKAYAEKAIHFYAYHVLMPSSNALLVSLLSGNLPACFRELRFLVETLAKCYLADLYHSEFSFFEKRLYFLQHPEDKKKRVPETDLIKEFAEKSGNGEKVVNLWRTLSEETHTKKFTERVVDNVMNHKNVPAYALVIPMVFRDGDLHDIQDLNNYIVSFGEILNKTMPK